MPTDPRDELERLLEQLTRTNDDIERQQRLQQELEDGFPRPAFALPPR